MNDKLRIALAILFALATLSLITWSAVNYNTFTKWCYDQNGHILQLGEGEFACFTSDGRVLGTLRDWMMNGEPKR